MMMITENNTTRSTERRDKVEDEEEQEEGRPRLRVLTGTCSWTEPTLISCGRFYPNPRTKGLMGRSVSSSVFAAPPSSSSSSSASSSSSSPSTSTSSSPSASPSQGEKRLWFYSRRLPSVEVDASNYAIPAPHLCEAWCNAVPSGFTFNVKAFCLFTAKQISTAASLPASVRSKMPYDLQQKSPLMVDDLPQALRLELWDCLNNSLSVFHRAGKLGAVLFQFPLGFMDTPQNREYVLSCRRMLHSDFTMAVEFRCASWLAQGSGEEASLIPAQNCTPGAVLPSYVKEDVIEWMQRNRMVFVIVDEFLEEWSDGTNAATSGSSRFSKRGPPPAFVSSQSLLSTSTSISASPPSSAEDSAHPDEARTATTATSTNPIAALGFQLCSRLLEQEQNQGTSSFSHSGSDGASTASLNSSSASTSPRKPGSGRRQLFTDDQAKPTDQARRSDNAVERKVRMVPIVERVTSPDVCYVRIHRRRGTNKRLTAAECDTWALRIRRLGNLLKGQGTIYVMMNTNYEDQGILNAADIAHRLPDLVPDWKAMQEQEAKQAKRHFMSLLFAGAIKKKKEAETDDHHDDDVIRHDLPEEENHTVEMKEDDKSSGESEEAEEADVVIVGHRNKVKEQKTIDALFTAGAGHKRKRDDKQDHERGQDDDTATTAAPISSDTAPPPPSSPAKKKTKTSTTTTKRTQHNKTASASKTSPARGRGQTSLLQSFTISKIAVPSSSSSSSSSS